MSDEVERELPQSTAVTRLDVWMRVHIPAALQAPLRERINGLFVMKEHGVSLPEQPKVADTCLDGLLQPQFRTSPEGEEPRQVKCEVYDCNEPQSCFHYCQGHHKDICMAGWLTREEADLVVGAIPLQSLPLPEQQTCAECGHKALNSDKGKHPCYFVLSSPGAIRAVMCMCHCVFPTPLPESTQQSEVEDALAELRWYGKTIAGGGPIGGYSRAAKLAEDHWYNTTLPLLERMNAVYGPRKWKEEQS